jgi:hypothetical protein
LITAASTKSKEKPVAISAHTRPAAARSSNGHRSAADDATIGELVATASRDVSLLIRQEVELAKTEVKAAATSAGLGAAFLGLAGFLGFFAFFAITIPPERACTRPASGARTRS